MALSQHNFQLEKDSSCYRKHSNQNDCYDIGTNFICRHFFSLLQDCNGYIPVFPLLHHIKFSKNEYILSYKFNRKNSREWTSVEHFLIGIWLFCTSLRHKGGKKSDFFCVEWWLKSHSLLQKAKELLFKKISANLLGWTLEVNVFEK